MNESSLKPIYQGLKLRKKWVKTSFKLYPLISVKSLLIFDLGAPLTHWGHALLDHALTSSRTLVQAPGYMHEKTTHKAPRPLCGLSFYVLLSFLSKRKPCCRYHKPQILCPGEYWGCAFPDLWEGWRLWDTDRTCVSWHHHATGQCVCRGPTDLEPFGDTLDTGCLHRGH